MFQKQRYKERDRSLARLGISYLLRLGISCVTTFKILGVVYDNFMTWESSRGQCV